jgi:hypothetical protein
VRSFTLPLLGALASAILLSACGGGASTAAQPTSTPSASAKSADTGPSPVAAPASPVPGTTAVTAASPAASGAAASGAAAASAPAADQKVNANTASVADMQRAFEAAGISNAARWAREVEEYRPYPTDDPSFAKLRRELAKYNPAPGVVDQIVSTLSL